MVDHISTCITFTTLVRIIFVKDMVNIIVKDMVYSLEFFIIVIISLISFIFQIYRVN